MKDEDIKWLKEQFQQVRKEKADLAVLMNKLYYRMLVAEIMLTKTKGFTKKRLETAQKEAKKIMTTIETAIKQGMEDKDIAQYKKYLPQLN